MLGITQSPPDLQLLSPEPFQKLPPRQHFDALLRRARFRLQTHNNAVSEGTVFGERVERAKIPLMDACGSFHFDGDFPVAKDEIHFIAAGAAEKGDGEIGVAVCLVGFQFHEDVVLKTFAEVGAADFRMPTGKVIGDADVEEVKLFRLDEPARSGFLPGRNADAKIGVFQDIEVCANGILAYARFARDIGIVEEFARCDGGDAQEFMERGNVPHQRFRRYFLLEVIGDVGAQVLLWIGREKMGREKP